MVHTLRLVWGIFISFLFLLEDHALYYLANLCKKYCKNRLYGLKKNIFFSIVMVKKGNFALFAKKKKLDIGTYK